MKEKRQASSKPAWLDPRNDRKKPFADTELDVFVDDFIAKTADTKAWQDLVAEFGEPIARDVLKQRLATQDANGLVNWDLVGPLHGSMTSVVANLGSAQSMPAVKAHSWIFRSRFRSNGFGWRSDLPIKRIK